METYQQYQAAQDLVNFTRDHAQEVYDAYNKTGDALMQSVEVIEQMIQEQGAFDNDVCPSAPRPLVIGETAHKFNQHNLCDECGALSENPFKQGDRVKYKDGDGSIFTVYAVYSDTELTLALADYPDIEQDTLTNVSEIEKA